MHADLTNIPANLFLSAKVLVEGLYQGRHATPDRGAGSTEFYDYRMYAPGDSVSRIDWKVFGRTDRLYLRRFQRFGNLTLQIIVDGSASMGFASPDDESNTTKWQYACQIAAALAVLAVRQSEQVALGIAVGCLEGVTAPSSTWAGLYRLIHMVEEFGPGGQVDMAFCLREAGVLLPRKHVLFVLSDFLDDDEGGVFEAVRRLRFQGHDVTMVQVLTPAECSLEGVRATRFVDCEMVSKVVSAEVGDIARSYTARMNEYVDYLHRSFCISGVDHNLVRTDEHPLDALRLILWKRMVQSIAGFSTAR